MPFMISLTGIAALLATLLATGGQAPPAQLSQQAAPPQLWPLLAASLAWLVPAGLTLMAAAAVPAQRAWHAAQAGIAAAALAIVAFFAVGFGLAFGGVGLIQSQVPGFDGLVWEWSFLPASWGIQWGMAGLRGWALGREAATPEAYALFFSQLPWVATAALVPLLALRGRTRAPLALLGGLLAGGILYPLAANWTWGGGWLANLGDTLNLGHGFVDFAAGGGVHLVGGALALSGLLVAVPRRARRAEGHSAAEVALPPVHLPLLASVGALLVLAGSLGWHWANPLLDLSNLLPMRGAINSLLAAAGGALLPLGYTWLVSGRPDALMTARGVAAGAIAGAVIGPFLTPSAALGLGAAAGILVPLLTYLVTETLRLADDTGVVAMHLAGSLVGLVGVGLLADGLAGAGWNGMGATSYLAVAGQGVAGLWVAQGFQPDWPGQLQAQAVGIAALFLVPFLVGTLLFGPVAILQRGLQRDSQPQAAGETPAEPPSEIDASLPATVEQGAD